MRLTTVRAVLDDPGPFVTVHADIGRHDEHGLDRLDAVCTTTRHALEHEGIDQERISAVEEHLRRMPGVAGDATRTVVLGEHDVLLDEVVPGPAPGGPQIEVGPLPAIGPWLEAADGAMRFALVLADREGADIEVYDALGRPPAQREEVHGESRDITKVAPGDWAQKQYQRRAENVWHGNAAKVAEAVRELLGDQQVRFVVLVGDERARTEIADLLEGVPVHQVGTGGRGAGASREVLDHDVERIVAEYDAHDEADLMERLERGRATGQGVAWGVTETLEALGRSEVERVVIDVRTAHEQTVDPGDYGGLAVPAAARDAGPLPLDEVAVAAAALTGAECGVLPAERLNGEPIAALLRWDMA